jgi:DNA-binding MarR family transcriptional regulator
LPKGQALDMTKIEKNKGESTGSVLHDLFREIFQLYDVLSSIKDTVHKQAGLGTPQRKIMQTLYKYGPATVPHIASRLDVSRQFVQTVCNDLITGEFINAVENPLHKRSKLIRISNAGLDALRQAQENENQIIEQALPEINPKDAIQAVKLLNRIRKKINFTDQ